jgi:hypothetical protein
MKDAKAAGVAIAVVFIVVIGVLLVQSITGYLTVPGPVQKMPYCPGYDKDKDGDYVNTQSSCKPNFDCNDNDPKINHLATEIPLDKIDNDCDWSADEDLPFFTTLTFKGNSADYKSVIGKDPVYVCKSYGFKGFVSGEYTQVIRFFKSLDDCKKGLSIEQQYFNVPILPIDYILQDFYSVCSANNATLPVLHINSGVTLPAGTAAENEDVLIILTCYN